jgi:threonine aldolase
MSASASDPALVDLRSDTVTRPSAAMRLAMANAEVGDDVFGDDPTVHALQERIADILGMEAALFVPSGTMANQIALRAHTRPGDEIIIGVNAHCWRHESGALAALGGIQTQVVGTDGTFTGSDVRAAFKGDDPYMAPTKVVEVENTHGASGGTVWDRAKLTDVVQTAKQLGMALHLDGARIWNAAAASGATEKELATGFDSASVCLSKGLGAPVGSLVAGTKPFIKACHRLRKMQGGGMRQAGILAAAGMFALDHHRPRIGEDHANARALAESLASTHGITVDLSRVQTNIVMFDIERGTVPAVIELAREEGVLLGSNGPRQLRAVCHLDVTREQVLHAAEVIAGIIAKL